MNKEVGTQWKTRGGWRSVIVDVYDDGAYRAWHDIGVGDLCLNYTAAEHLVSAKTGEATAYDLVELWTGPKPLRTIDVDVHVYFDENGVSFGCQSAEQKAKFPPPDHPKIFAAFHIQKQLTEGEGI